MKIKEPYQRLKKFWGKVDHKHIKLISKFVVGSNVLDIGCGYGTTTAYITNKLGLNCIGVDLAQETIEDCKVRYKNCDFRVANVENMPFEDDCFDTIILRDALHHFYQEADFEKVKKELLRVGKPHTRIIFFDPNINLLLKTMRKIAVHDDAECDFETALKVQKDMGFEVIHNSFNTIFSLPLSGGYVGINFIPDFKFLQKIILKTEEVFEKVVNIFGLGRQLCWRYLIVGQKEDKE